MRYLPEWIPTPGSGENVRLAVASTAVSEGHTTPREGYTSWAYPRRGIHPAFGCRLERIRDHVPVLAMVDLQHRIVVVPRRSRQRLQKHQNTNPLYRQFLYILCELNSENTNHINPFLIKSICFNTLKLYFVGIPL